MSWCSSYVFWADDGLIFGEDEVSYAQSWVILSEEFEKVALAWKPGSLEMMVAGFNPGPGATPCVWNTGTREFSVAVVSQFVFLGGLITSDGDPYAMAVFRANQGASAFGPDLSSLCVELSRKG